MSFAVRDAALSVTKALPSGASAVNSDGIDLGHGTTGEHLAKCELLIEAPAVTTAMLADTATIKYDVADSADNSSFSTIAATVLTQTGASSAGAAAASKRFRLPTTVRRYVRVTATKSAAGDASSVSMTVSLVF